MDAMDNESWERQGYTYEMHYSPNQISLKMNLSEDDVKQILSQIAGDKNKKKK